MTDDLVADADGQWYLAPAAIDAVDVGATDTAALDLDVDIMVTELLGFELLFLELGPFLLIRDHETFESIWISHGCGVFSVAV